MNRFKEYVNGRSCGILGLGVSNLPLAEMICDMGVSLTVRDKKSPVELGERALELQRRGVRFVSGEGAFDNINEDIIFRSPGIRPDIPALCKALANGAELTSEIEQLLELCVSDTYAITGSDGKTTSTTLTGKFLEAEAKLRGEGKVYVGGNIGTPLLSHYAEMTESDSTVLELSSFQLMTVKKAPENIAITNISPNHLDWHRGMEEYINAKKNIIGANTKRVVVNAENAATREIGIKESRSEEKEVIFFSSSANSFDEAVPAEAGKCLAVFLSDGFISISDGNSSKKLLDTSIIKLPGKHNIENFMTAMALTYGKVSADAYKTVAESFLGVEHRLELVRTLDGVDYYNSSIDSSPTRTAAALSALGSRDIVVICGGYDKKIPFEPLAEALFRCAKAVVLTGATADKILEAVNKYGMEHNCADKLEIERAEDITRAIYKAKSMAEKLVGRGSCVLLSPACASFDAFKNFAERGNTFKRIVNEL